MLYIIYNLIKNMFNDYTSQYFEFQYDFVIYTETHTLGTHTVRRAEINKDPYKHTHTHTHTHTHARTHAPMYAHKTCAH